jgi:hypothetical protein
MMSTFTDVYPEIKFGQYTTEWDATQVMLTLSSISDGKIE